MSYIKKYMFHKKKKKEDINDVKVLNMITNKCKGKTYFM